MKNQGLRSSSGERINAQPTPIDPYADLLHRQAHSSGCANGNRDSGFLQETKVESMWILSLVATIALPQQYPRHGIRWLLSRLA